MRSYIILLLVLASTSFQELSAQGPTLDSFYKTGTKWKEYLRIHDYNTGIPDVTSTLTYQCYELTVGADAIINGVLHHPISYTYKGRYTHVYSQNWNDSVEIEASNTLPQMLGLLRIQDSTIFFMNTANLLWDYDVYSWYMEYPTGNEILIYELGLMPGDTSHTWWSANSIVTGLDSIQLSNGSYVKSISFSNGMSASVIGSEKGLLVGIPGGGGTFDVENFSLCYSGDHGSYEFGDTTLPSEIYDSCAFHFETLSVSAQKPNIADVQVYPNPLSGTDVYFSSIENIESVSAYTMSGTLISTSSREQIDVTKSISLPEISNVYLLRIELADGQVVYRKVLKL